MPTHDTLDKQKTLARKSIENLLGIVPAQGYQIRTELATQNKQRAVVLVVVEKIPQVAFRRNINVWAAPQLPAVLKQPELMTEDQLARKLAKKPRKKRRNLLPKPPKR